MQGVAQYRVMHAGVFDKLAGCAIKPWALLAAASATAEWRILYLIFCLQRVGTMGSLLVCMLV